MYVSERSQRPPTDYKVQSDAKIYLALVERLFPKPVCMILCIIHKEKGGLIYWLSDFCLAVQRLF